MSRPFHRRHETRTGHGHARARRCRSLPATPNVYNRFGMPYHNPIPEDRRPRRDKDSGGLATLVQAEKMIQIAILLPSAAFIGWLLGAWADRALHQDWIGIAGIVFGGISGLVYVIRLVVASGKDDGGAGKGSGSGL